MQLARRLAKKLPFLRHKPTQHPHAAYPNAYRYMSVDDTSQHDAVFVIDDSGSIPSDDFNKGLKALRTMIDRHKVLRSGHAFV